jgi:hypothetical protein
MFISTVRGNLRNPSSEKLLLLILLIRIFIFIRLYVRPKEHWSENIVVVSAIKKDQKGTDKDM